MIYFIVFILQVFLFPNDFIWEKVEIGDNLTNSNIAHLGCNDSQGNIVFYDKDKNYLYFKHRSNHTWESIYKNDIDIGIEEVLSVFISNNTIYLLVLYPDLTQSLVNIQIDKNELTNEYKKFQSFEFYTDSLIKLNKIIKLNDEYLISYSDEVNKTDYFILHYIKNDEYKFKCLSKSLDNKKNTLEGNKISNVHFRMTRTLYEDYKYDLVFITAEHEVYFPFPITTDNFDSEHFSYLHFPNVFRIFNFELEYPKFNRNAVNIKPISILIENYNVERTFLNHITNSIYSLQGDKLNTNDITFVLKSRSFTRINDTFDKVTLLIEDKGELLTDFIRFKNTVFFMFYKYVDNKIYTYFSNDKCDTWYYFISDNLEYTGKFDYCIGDDDVYIFNENGIYKTDNNNYFSNNIKLTNIYHYHSGAEVLIISRDRIEEIDIYDILGKKIFSNASVNTKTFRFTTDLLGNAIGSYFCIVKTKKEVKLIKIMKDI